MKLFSFGIFWLSLVVVLCPAVMAQEERLTNDGRIKRDPVYLSDSNVIVFTQEDHRTGKMRLMKLKLDDLALEPFDANSDESRREFCTNATGSVFAFNVVRGLSSKIRVIDQRDSRSTTLPKVDKETWSNWPTISPDGRTIVWVEGARVMYAYDLSDDKGKESVRRFSANGTHYSDYMPSYSPSGEQIVFVSNRDRDFEIYLMNADGTGQQRLTESRGIDMHPRFSPNGKQIAFTSNRDGNYEIYVMDVQTGTSRRITRNDEIDDFPCWLPHVTGEIVYVSQRDGKTDLYRLRLSKPIANRDAASPQLTNANR